MKTSEKLAEIKKRVLPPHLAGTEHIYKVLTESPIAVAIDLFYQDIGAEMHVRMNGYTTMRRWLIDYAGIDEAQVTTFRAQVHCLNWMDELIKEFKAKGD